MAAEEFSAAHSNGQVVSHVARYHDCVDVLTQIDACGCHLYQLYLSLESRCVVGIQECLKMHNCASVKCYKFFLSLREK